MNELDIQPAPYENLRELALFAGAGGGVLGGKLLGWQTVCAVEREAYPAQVLAQRQNDGIFEPFPIWSDVSSFDGRPWRKRVDVVSGGFPCQDISSAGNGAGIEGPRSGLWSEMLRIIGEVRPKYAFMENSPLLVGRGLAVVISDLAKIGYSCVWGIMGAADVGANHKRERCWILAYPKSVHVQGLNNEQGEVKLGGGSWWQVEPRLDRVADGVADSVDRLKAIGNGQVPRVAAEAFIELHKRIGIR